MRPLDRVNRTRRALAVTIVTRAALGAAAATLLTAALLTAVTRATGLATSTAGWLVGSLAGAIALALLMRPWRRLTVPRVSLWIEERVPGLQYALVTAVDSLAVGPGAVFLE